MKECYEQIDELTFNSRQRTRGRWSIKQMEAFRKQNELKSLQKHQKDDLINFEELGVDSLFVDEAHYYKMFSFF